MSGVPIAAARAGRRLAAFAVLISAALAVFNLLAGLHSGSVAVRSLAFEFASDVLASAVVWIGFAAAAKPADARHPYGHGRVEPLAAFVLGLLLVIGGAAIGASALRGVGQRHAAPAASALIALALTFGVRTVSAAVKFRAGRRLRSTALVADGWNDTVDLLAIAASAAAVALARWDPGRFLAADHYGGFGVGIVVCLIGLRVVRDASLELMDTMPGAAMMAEVRRVALADPDVGGVEEARARKTGLQYHVDLHIEVDPGLTVAASHEIAGRVRHRLRGELPWVADVLVHVEPTPSDS